MGRTQATDGIMEPRSIELKITNQLGLHARPASAFVRVASGFDSEIMVEKDGEVVNGKSLISLLMLAAGCGASLKVTANGADSNEAINALDEMARLDQVFTQE